MRRKLFLMFVVCLVCAFSALAQEGDGGASVVVNEKQTRLLTSEKSTTAVIVVENAGRSYDETIELEILDTTGKSLYVERRAMRLAKGVKSYKIPLSWSVALAQAGDKLDWYLLRYKIGARSGHISFSELLEDNFQLRVAASEAIFNGTTQRVRVRAVHPFSGAAVKNVRIAGEIEIEFDDDREDLIIKQNGETDGEGFAVLDFKIPENVPLDDADLTVEGRKNGIAREVWEDFDNDDQNGRILLTTDKPIYQPGQDFNVRGLYFDANNTVVADTELEFKILDGDDTVLFKEKIKTSAFGIASVKWKIPEGAKLGDYRVEVETKDDLDENRLIFKVSRYDLPNFAVTAKPDKTFYLPADTQAEIAVTADYLFGKPVTRGKVRVVQEGERRWSWRAQKYDVDEKAVFEGETDTDRKYVAKVDLRAQLNGLKSYGGRKYEDLRFSAYYTDLSTNRTEQRRFDVRISAEPIHIYLMGPNKHRGQNLPISQYISTFYADGSPAVCDVEIKGKGEDKHGDDKFQTLQRIKTNSYGAGKSFFKSPLELDADENIELRISARDQKGQTGTTEKEIYWNEDDEGLQIETDKTIFKPGEAVKVQILSSRADDFVYVDVVKERTSLATFLVKIADGRGSLKIPYNENFKGELTVSVYSDDEDDSYDWERRDARGVIFPAEENLKIEANFEKAAYKPNEDARLKLSSLDGAGKPIETALGVVIFDRAVEERARTDAEFGSYFSRYAYLLGYGKSFGGVSVKDLNGLNLSKNISPELQLVAEVIFSDNYAYPRIHHSRIDRTAAKDLYAEYFKKQFTPIEAALKNRFETTGEYPTDENSARALMQAAGLNFDETRDVWGNLYRPEFKFDKTLLHLTWTSAGADEAFDTKDDFSVSASTFEYFQPIGRAIDKTAADYYERTGKYIRDRETLRAELIKQNIELDALKDRWNRDYRIYFETSGRNYIIRFYSTGPDGLLEQYYWHGDDFDAWKTTQDYFFRTERKIIEILGQNVNGGRRPFPKNADEFVKMLKQNDFAFENITDGYGRSVYLLVNTFSRYADKTTVENGKQKVTPVTEEIVDVKIYGYGADEKSSSDDPLLAQFSGVVSERSKETGYQSAQVKTVAFAGAQGAIRGVVTDASGAAVPAAVVTVTNPETGWGRTAATDEAGRFLLENLPTGKYHVRIDASGFKTSIYDNLDVKPQNVIEISVTLEIGGVSEMVTVDVGATDIQVDTSRMAVTVESRQITELPINGRRASDFASLQPGVTAAETVVIDGKEFVRDESGKLVPLAPNSTPRLREYFPETLLWSPEIITDKSGRAEVKFKFADNITTWKLYTIASTKNGKIGVAEKEVQAFQPFFADLEPPKFLTTGDEIHLPTQIRNYTGKKQKVGVEMAKSDWFSFLGADKQTLEVATDASENAIFGFRADRAVEGGKQKVTAVAETDADAIEKPVTVRPNGHEVVRTETALFTKNAAFDVNFPQNALPETQRAELKIYPNLLAHVTESVEGLLQRPYGCGEQTISSTYPNLMILKFIKNDSMLKKTAKIYLQKGYERLLGYQVASGGFSYWGGKDEADLALTTYALRFLSDAREFIAIDEESFKKAQNWLAAQQRADGSFTKKYYYETTEDKNRTKLFTSYVARTLAMTGEKDDQVLQKALTYLKTENARIDEPYALALFGLASLDAGNAPDAAEVAATLAKMAISENNAAYWNLETNTPFYGWGTAGRVETTALVVQFLIKNKLRNSGGEIPNVDALISRGTLFLLKNKDRYGVWYSTQTTINVLDSFLAALGSQEKKEENRQIQIMANGAPLETFSAAPDQITPIIIKLDGKLLPAENRLEIQTADDSAVMAQIVQKHYIDWKDAAAEEKASGTNANVSRAIRLDYRCDRQSVKIMDEISCAVDAERVGFKGYGMLLAEIGIPPGADVSRESLQKAMDNDSSLSRYDILPDRIVFYMWAKAGGTKINFKFKPRYGISAQSPASIVYDYYNEEAKATLAPLKFEVK